MAVLRWVGKAAAVNQVSNITVGGAPAAGQIYTVTINDKDWSYTAGALDTNLTIAAALASILSICPFPEFQEIQWGFVLNVIVATAGTAGKPFTVSSSATGAGTLVTTAITPNSSPNDVNNPLNWSTGSLPVNTDSVYIDNTDMGLWWNLDALAAVVLTKLVISNSFTGTIGLPEYNTDGTPYAEYRPQYFQIGPGALTVGDLTGIGSGRLKFDFGAASTSVNVINTGSPLDSDREALLFKGSTSTLAVAGGSVGVAVFGGETTTISGAIKLLSPAGGGGALQTSLRLGAGVTISSTITQSGGDLIFSSNVSTWTAYGGTASILGAATVTTLTNNGAVINYLSSGTITTAKVAGPGVLDFSSSPAARTVTNCSLYAGATLLDPYKTVTWSNAIQLQQCKIGDVTIDVGANAQILPS